MKSAVETLQPLGRALMLPIAVLPVAGLLLRFGQQDIWDTLQLGAAVHPFLPFVAAAGNAIFANLGLLFAVGVAIGLAKENHGAAGLAGVVCFVVATEGAKALMGVPPDVLAGMSANARDLASEAFKAKALAKLGVPIGIISGLIAGGLYNRFHDIKLPDYLAFFGGRRFVPIVSGFAALIFAAAIGLSWSSISQGMDALSHTVLRLGAFGLFMYGALNRFLIVTGLHHILNNIAWFILGDYHGVTGDLKRFFAGDPTAGAFMSGFFPVMMFGLPAACLAMYHTARPERRKEVGGLLASMALTAILTGVTEPIEFSFMFLAPPLYAIHAVLTGISMVVMNALGVHLGFSFSAGAIDFAINWNKSTKPWLLAPVGLAYFALYYGIFRFTIVRFNLKTLGREDAVQAAARPVIGAADRGRAYLDALGGTANLRNVDACTTRLRLEVASSSAIDEPRLKALGARGFVRLSANSLQVVVGPAADQIAGEIRAALSAAPGTSSEPLERAAALPEPAAVVASLGGASNIRSVAACASRLIVTLQNASLADNAALQRLGARGVVSLQGSVQILLGPEAEGFAERLNRERSRA
jgi:PTS system N-acetylglucosamine-specific IIC component